MWLYANQQGDRFYWIKPWWARQGLNLRPHPCEGFTSVPNSQNASLVERTDGDSSANEAALTDHNLTTPLTWGDCAVALGWRYIPALDAWQDTQSHLIADDAEMACDLSGYETLESAIRAAHPFGQCMRPLDGSAAA